MSVLPLFSQPDVTPLQPVNHPAIKDSKVELWIKRDDLIHPLVSGNKWRKLKYNLLHMKQQKHTTVLSFGGAYSNHIHALAAAARASGLKSIGVIRGEATADSNPTLRFARSQGMQLCFVDRQDYRHKSQAWFIDELKKRWGDFYLLPEGGSNELALKGVAEMVGEVRQQSGHHFDVLVSACGSGGTLAGMVSGLRRDEKALGIAVLKGAGFLYDDVGALLGSSCRPTQWDIALDCHWGGYARISPALIEFIAGFRHHTGVLLEPVYTGKMMYGLFDLIRQDYFPAGHRIVAVHSGGMQGLAGLRQRYPWIDEKL